MNKSNSKFIVAALCAFFISACAPATPEQQVYDAAQYVQKGDVELVKAAEKIDADNASSAQRHMNKAMKDYDKAVVLLADASLPESQEGVVDAMKKGMEHLENALKAIEKEDYEKAEEQYSMAQSAFDAAGNMLN